MNAPFVLKLAPHGPQGVAGARVPSRRKAPHSRLGMAVLLGCAVLLCHSPNARAQSVFRCAQVLTAPQVAAAVGETLELKVAPQQESGASECVWTRRGEAGNAAGAASLDVRFFDRQAIGANPVTRTTEGYFDMLLKAAEEASDKKREVLAGVPKAAIIVRNSQILLVVHRRDGVARIVLNNLGRAQAQALAKAVAAAS